MSDLEETATHLKYWHWQIAEVLSGTVDEVAAQLAAWKTEFLGKEIGISQYSAAGSGMPDRMEVFTEISIESTEYGCYECSSKDLYLVLSRPLTGEELYKRASEKREEEHKEKFKEHGEYLRLKKIFEEDSDE